MPIIKTEAVILKCDKYRETSSIVTFYSREHGKVKGIAKGVRNSKSRWGGALQPMAFVSIMYYYKETRNLHLISGAEYIKPYSTVYDDYDKMQLAFRMVELINKTTAESQENTNIYNLLIESLFQLDDSSKNIVNVLFNFKFRLLSLLGFRLDTSGLAAGNIEKDIENPYFYETKLSAGDVKTIEALSGGNFKRVMALNISKTQVFAFDKFFENYLRTHFEHAGYSNTKRVFSSQEMF